jgi:hypothetical protein
VRSFFFFSLLDHQISSSSLSPYLLNFFFSLLGWVSLMGGFFFFFARKSEIANPSVVFLRVWLLQ